MHKYIPEYLVDEDEDVGGLRQRADAKGDHHVAKAIAKSGFNTHYKVAPSLPLMGKIGLSR